MHKKLFTPGPVEVRPEILQAMSTPQIHHRSPEFSRTYDDVQENLKRLLYTENPVFLITSSSTGAMQAAVTNTVSKKCLNLVNGAFSTRWHQITERNGLPNEKLDLEWDRAIKPAMVDEKLKTGKFDAVALVFNETSTGMMNPLPEIAEVVKQYPDVLLLVDAVSGMAGAKIEVDKWGVDVCLAGVQKAFALPSGLTVASISQKALDRAEKLDRGYYFNFPLLLKYHKRSQTRVTPCIAQIFALQEQLKEMMEEEGLENRFKRHKEMASIVQNWAREKFDLFPEEGYESVTLTCVKNTRGISVADLNNELIEKHNIRISNGYGDLKEKTFRIAHMGDIQIADVRGLLATIDDILGI